MTEQKESDQPVAAVQATQERRPTERRSTEERIAALERMVIRPEWVKRVESRMAALEQTVDQLDANLVAANARIAALERVAGLSPHMQTQMGMRDRTSQVRAAHEDQVMAEALSRRKEAEDRVKSRIAAHAAARA